MSLGRRILIDTLAILSAIWLILPLSCGAAENQTRNVEKEEEEEFEDLSPGAIVGIVFGVLAGVIIIGKICAMKFVPTHRTRSALALNS
ncbi:unnamed protein product [Dibothriocephalus latus]|uniref:Uncharacterized protein n=1 Tax=Dibothriocephalus latus TaxID=60516 RepID=A0A3P7NRR2_DIBLA|nr:unnamed protein product [Dibothriocephalus latus]